MRNSESNKNESNKKNLGKDMKGKLSMENKSAEDKLAREIMHLWGFPDEFDEQWIRKRLAGKYNESWKEDFYVEKKRRKYAMAVANAHKIAKLAIKILKKGQL